MAETTDNDTFEVPGTALSDFSVPDKDDLGWTPAETVFVDVAPGSVIGEFVIGATLDADDSTVIEFDIADVQMTDLIADFDLANVPETDLNSLLNSVAVLLDSEPVISDGNTMLTSLDEAVSNPQASENTVSFSHQTGFGLGELTVVIDDDGTDIVAI